MLYRDLPVLTTRLDFKTIDHGQVDDFVYDPRGLGAAVPWKATTGPKRTVKFPFILDRVEARELRVFKAGRLGRLKPFWLPLYLNDYPLIEDATAEGLELIIRNIGLAEKVAFGPQFQHLALLTPDKTECYGIESVIADGDIETITLDTGLLTDLDAARTVCCGLMLARFAEDETEWRYRGREVVRAEIMFEECPAEIETPHEGHRIAFLYRIKRGAAIWLMTSWPVPLEINEDVWQPNDISHGEIAAGIEFLSEPLDLRLATDDPQHPFRAYIEPYVIDPTEVEIFEVDVDDPASLDLNAPIYAGRAGNVSFERDGEIRVELSSILRVSELQGPRIMLQRMANLQALDPLSGLNPAAFTTTGEITAISAAPPYIEAAEFEAKAVTESDPNWFALGKVTVGAEVRLCTGQDGARLHLNAPFRLAGLGHDASAEAGDDKRITTWATKFNNAENFVGFPYLPNKNPQFEALMAPKPKGGKK